MIASPDARDGSLLVHQDACLYQLLLDKEGEATHTLEKGRTVYVHVVSGQLTVEGKTLREGDGATIKDVDLITFKAIEGSKALVFDLP